MKRLITTMFVCSCFFVLNNPLNAQNQQPTQDKSEKIRIITVEDAVNLAAENNISLKSKQVSLKTLERRYKSSWNGVGPSASVTGNVVVPLDGLVTDMKAKQDYTYGISASASLSLTPSLYTTIREAQLNYENGELTYEDAVRQIELKVRKDFYNLIYNQENIKLQKRNMETARLRYQSNLEKYNRGQLSELDLLQSQYNYESLRPQLESLEISYQNSLAVFKLNIGLPQNEEIELSGNLSDALPAASFTVSQSVEALSSIKQLENNIAIKKNSLLATRFSAYGPTVGASYSWGLNGNDKTDELKKHSESHSLSFNVRIPLDGLIPWSNGVQNIVNQKASIKDLELQLQNEKTSAELTLQNSIKKITQMQNQIEMYDRNVEIARKAYDMTLAAYNHGSKDLYTLQNTANSLLRAETDRELQRYNLICAVLELENTLGLPFGSLGTE